MNQQEQATKSAAIFQDTINGTNAPTPWPVTMWASSGDTIWTAGTARTAGEDSVGMIYGPGDTIVHRNTIAGDTTRATESFAIRPADGQSPMDAMLAGIEQWNHRHPDRWDTVATPGQYRMTDPTTGRQLPMGWSASLAAAASAAGRLDPDLLQASLMQNAVEHEPRPCVFFLEDNGYDLMVFSWHRNQQGLFDAMSFKHLQYDDLSMQVTTISHSEDMSEPFPAKTMSDGELLTQSRIYRDEYQHWREQDGGTVAQGMTGRVMRSGLLKPGLEQKPLLNLNDGRRAPDWDEFTDQAAISILQGQPISPTPALPQQEQPERDTDPAAVTQTPARTAAATKQVWPNAWVANRLAHTYILHAKDGRDWPKMIVGLPRGTAIDGKDLTGWATDMFMSAKNQRQKNEGRAVNIRFRPGTPVELFTGRGAERRTMQVDPQTLVQAVIDAQKRNRDAEETLDAYSYQTVERKQRFISQLMSSKSPAREAADLDADVVTLANIKALATGDPDIQRRMTLENEINQLKLLRASWAQQKADTRRDIGQQLQPRIEGIRQAIREKTDDKPLASKALSIHQTARMNGRWEGMTINGQPVGDRQTACRLLHQAAHQAHDGDTIAEYDGLPVIARRAATTGRITLAVKAIHEHESGTEMPGPYLTGPSSIVSQLDRIVRNMATDPGKLTERLADAERELAAAQETLAEPFAHEDEYRQKQAELERLTSKPDEPRETESRDQETKERSAGMPLTTENARRLLEQDPDITEVTQGGNAMGHYLEARLTDGRAVQIDFHDNPAWKDTDRLAGRIEVSYANRPQAEWQYDDNDMADREHTVIDPADPAAEKTLAKAVEGWERAGGLHAARASEKTSHLAATRPPEEYAYRWRKPGDPDRHIAYLSTAFDRDQAMRARENAGYLVTKVEEDPAILYERHRKASCLHASHILERYDSPDPTAVGILHGIVSEVNAHDPENDIAAYLTYPSDKAVQLAGDGLTEADIAEKREMGGWDPRKDPLMRINEQGDWTGVTQQQADQLVWDNRDEILARASYDSELSTWTLHQLDQLKEPQPAQSLDRDRPEPDREAPAQTESTTKRRGPRL